MSAKQERLVLRIFWIIKSEAIGRFAIWINFIIVMAVLGTVLVVKFL